MLDELLDGLRRRDRLALSRLLTLVGRSPGFGVPHPGAWLPIPVKPSRVVAFTGSGGVGKSSLIGKMIDVVRRQGQTVAVLACDPQSSLSGGALLGDRFRMGSRTDDGVFIRSLAALSGHGAIADHLDGMCRVLEAFGFDVIFLETVGALLLQPETGDDLQWEKAGVLEVVDVVVVHKADLPGADEVAGQVRAALELSHAPAVPVLLVSARSAQGLEELWQTIARSPLRRTQDAGVRRELLRLVQDAVATRFQDLSGNAELARLVEGWQQGTLTVAEVVDSVLGLIVTK
jgi:putative protein kinase ArgK-like GTPase of G3E family